MSGQDTTELRNPASRTRCVGFDPVVRIAPWRVGVDAPELATVAHETAKVIYSAGRQKYRAEPVYVAKLTNWTRRLVKKALPTLKSASGPLAH